MAAVHQACPECRIKIYVRAGPTAEELVQDAASRFHIDVAPARIAVVPLTQAHLLLPERYPRLTLLRQALGSVLLAREALQALTPQVFIDTTGWAFTYPLARLAGCRVACYVHYPTISTNMLDRVWAQQAGYNNDAAIAGSGVKTLAKWLYYQLLALVYGLAGSCAHVVMVNSRWTKAHIDRLWWARGRPAQLVHPPVDTEQLQQLPLDRRLKRLFLVSVQQFRPEKNHALQLEAWALARRNAAAALAGGGGQSGSGGGLSPQAARAVLVATVKMVGSCRNDADRGRLAALQRQADDLGLGTSVEWHVNVPFDELKAMLGGAVGGLHTMVDEHFGISVVEYMAAGVIPIAHDSGRSQCLVPSR